MTPKPIDENNFVMIEPGHWRQATLSEQINWTVYKAKKEHSPFFPRGYQPMHVDIVLGPPSWVSWYRNGRHG